jgi:glutathione S-transferase
VPDSLLLLTGFVSTVAVGYKKPQENEMLKLHVFGPYFGLPDGSPFCIKALILMKMSGLPFTQDRMAFNKAPKGKAPYLTDGDKIIADSHFLMRHLETSHGADFSKRYAADDLAKGWAVARMLEEHFYFLSMGIRWLNDENFYKGPYQFFAAAPAPIRPLVARIVRGKIRKTQHLQGLGRHSLEERVELAKGDIDAVEAMLGDKPYFLGATPSGVDASVCGFLWAAATPFFNSPIGDHIRSRPKLTTYITRMAATFFPDHDAGFS